jgi:hypothetical protein
MVRHFYGTHSGTVSSIAQKEVGAAKSDAMQADAIEQLERSAKEKGFYLATYCNDGSYPQYTHGVKDDKAWHVVDATTIRPY